MNSTTTHVIISVFALALAFSAMYVFSEGDKITNVFYGSTRHLSVPPNSNATIMLGRVSDGIEWTPSFTIQLGSPYPWWNQSTSIPQPSGYSFRANLSVSVQVNKSAFVLLEDYTLYEPMENRTVGFKAFFSSDSVYPGEPLQCEMELRHTYQLKIGNYETSITNWNQSGSHELIIENTDRTLNATIGPLESGPLGPPGLSGPSDSWGSPSYRITITFTKEPNIYIVSGLVVLDAGLIITYVFSNRKRDSETKVRALHRTYLKFLAPASNSKT